MTPPFPTARRSLLAIVAVYIGAALYVALDSPMTIAATALLGIVTLIPALVLSSLSRTAGHAGPGQRPAGGPPRRCNRRRMKPGSPPARP